MDDISKLQDLVHDIKQPLSVVKGFSYLAIKAIEKDPLKAQEYLKKIDEQSNLMTELLNQLSDEIKKSMK